MISPITGKLLEMKIRAYCMSCGCLVSHKSVKAVKKAIDKYMSCCICGRRGLTVKYTFEEGVYGGLITKL